MQNVEFKAELRDPQFARFICRNIGAKSIGTIHQKDTYFRIPDGRLKKRETDGEPAEYVFYHRINRLKPKLSHFTIFTESEAIARFGERPLPVWVVVEKRRDLWMYRHVRLHLDEVARLGHFFEAEALVTPSHHIGRCQRRIAAIREKFAPVLGELIATSYCDLAAAELREDAERREIG